jgi:hypothetical protein
LTRRPAREQEVGQIHARNQQEDTDRRDASSAVSDCSCRLGDAPRAPGRTWRR